MSNVMIYFRGITVLDLSNIELLTSFCDLRASKKSWLGWVCVLGSEKKRPCGVGKVLVTMANLCELLSYRQHLVSLFMSFLCGFVVFTNQQHPSPSHIEVASWLGVEQYCSISGDIRFSGGCLVVVW